MAFQQNGQTCKYHILSISFFSKEKIVFAFEYIVRPQIIRLGQSNYKTINQLEYKFYL